MVCNVLPIAARSAVALLLVGAVGACAHGVEPRRFGLRAPVLRDQDLDLVTIPCKPDKPCGPEMYESSFSWDAADNTLFRPISEALILKPQGPAQNVNAFDEVPDSSWFTNRIGTHPMTEDEVAEGYCKAGKKLNPDLPDGGWLIDHGKDNGANPGFRVLSEGVKYMLKIDETQGERATAATSISTRFYYAAGWWAPCDAIVYFRRPVLKLKPGLTIKANVGLPKKFDEALLTEILSKAPRRGPLYRAAASRWLPGKPLGPFTYGGVRKDDPSDLVPHEHRRDLRGAGILAAWLNHFDSREQNSMSTWLEEEDLEKERKGFEHSAAYGSAPSANGRGEGGSDNEEKKGSKKPPKDKMRGYVRHWYIDIGDSFGSEWTVDGFSRRHGHAYILDFPYLAKDFITFGAIERPWDRNHLPAEAPIFGYFSERDFEPDHWHNEYPNPAFSNLDEGDGAWIARIIARFTPGHVAAAIRAGDLTDPAHRDYLLRVLLARQQTILRRYFSKLSPITDVTLEPGRLCAVDLARKTGAFSEPQFRYKATIAHGDSDRIDAVVVAPEPGGRVCLPLASTSPNGGTADDAPSRYLVVRITNGVAPGPIALHLYDLGPARGLSLVGIERPAP